MAYAAVGTWSVNLSFLDRDNNPGKVSLNAPSAAVLEDITGWINTTLAPSMVALSDAKLVKVSVSQDWVDATVAASTPAESADVERKGVFVFKVAAGYPSKVELPSFKNTKVIDGTDTINTADTDVAAFIAWMTDNSIFDTVGMANPRGEALTALKSAPHKIHRESSKG